MATIQGIYVALFGRPADPTGLAYFNGVTNNGANLTAIGDLASTQEYKDRFSGFTNTQIVSAIYQSLFNRDPEAAGLNFFVDALNKGTLNIKNIAIAILDGAQGSDKTVVDAKIASANTFTVALDTPTEIANYSGNTAAAQGRAFLADVTTTPKTTAQADTAITALVAANNVGKSDIALTNGNDAVNTTTTTAALKTTDKNDTIATTGANWDVANDVIDGGFGTDTFNITAGVTAAVAANALKSIEVINFTSGAAAATLTVTEAKELTQVWNKASADDVTITGVSLATTVGIEGTVTAGKDATFVFANAGGTADTANLALKDASVTTAAGDVTIANIETLNVSNSGTSTLAELIVANTTTLNVSGAGTLTAVVNAAELVTVNNSSTGTVSLDLTAANKLATYNGSAVSDVVTLDTAHTANQTVNLGAGSDQVTVLKSGAPVDFAITISGGAGSDLFTFGAATAGVDNVKSIDTTANLVKSLITITDFDKAADTIKFIGDTSVRDTLSAFELGNISGQANLLDAVKAAAGFTNENEVSVFVYGTDTYLFANNVGAGTLDAGDGLVKITGISNVADLTTSNFQLS